MRIASWNLGDGPAVTKAGALTRLFKVHDADVICLQEAGDRKHLIDAWCEETGWHAWFGNESGSPSVPILWNPAVLLATVTGTTPATPPTRVGKAGAGPSTMKPKIWNRVRFVTLGPKGRTEPVFVVINGHVVPSVYLPRRRDLARRHIAVLAEMVKRREGRVDVIAVGDFNMRPSHPLAKPLREAGMVQRTKQPTHGRRIIDHVWTLGVAGDVDVIEMPSDHNAVILTIKEKP